MVALFVGVRGVCACVCLQDMRRAARAEAAPAKKVQRMLARMTQKRREASAGRDLDGDADTPVNDHKGDHAVLDHEGKVHDRKGEVLDHEGEAFDTQGVVGDDDGVNETDLDELSDQYGEEDCEGVRDCTRASGSVRGDASDGSGLRRAVSSHELM